LGGLIRENSANSKSGIPFLKDVPLLGNLFGATVDNATRTELLVMLTPKAVRSQSEARNVTDEYRQRLQQLEATMPGRGNRPIAGPRFY
jgi:general secretion pathway protein D